MKSHLALQDADTKLYWLGNYGNMQWTDNVRRAALFDRRRQINQWMDTPKIKDIMSGRVLIVVRVYGR